MRKKVVLALGGNALGYTPEEQIAAVEHAAKAIVGLVEDGYDVIIGHGNGPQVGLIQLAMDSAAHGEAKTPIMPLVECGAMSQGYIGYHLQQAIDNEIISRKLPKQVACIVTRVEVDPADKAFQNPTKPVGTFYSKEEADKIIKEKGFTFVEDSGRGYRRVVPSPNPKSIVEINVVKNLVESGVIVITIGGGGIPVVQTECGKYKGVDAVIDKDKSSAKLASDMNADILLILTAVEYVAINYNKPNQENLRELSVDDAKKHIADNQFAKGSMLPKVEACMDFITAKPGRAAIITSLEKSREALRGETGTKIYS